VPKVKTALATVPESVVDDLSINSLCAQISSRAKLSATTIAVVPGSGPSLIARFVLSPRVAGGPVDSVALALSVRASWKKPASNSVGRQQTRAGKRAGASWGKFEANPKRMVPELLDQTQQGR
jgi:hypothetical protein